jgi:hypothetical protein
MLNRKTTPIVTDASPADPLAELREFLASLQKGAVLQLAERTLCQARSQRVEIVERERRLIAAVTEGNYTRAQAREAQGIERELADIDARIGTAKNALRQARGDWSPKLHAALAPHRAAAARAVIEAVTLLNGAAAIFRVADDFALRNGIELAPRFDPPPALDYLLPQARKLAEAK